MPGEKLKLEAVTNTIFNNSKSYVVCCQVDIVVTYGFYSTALRI